MKQILLPVDMRVESDNSTRYAVSLARKSGASIMLFHTFQVPVPPSEVPLPVMPVEEIREQTEKALKEHAEKLKANYPDVSFDYAVGTGDVEHSVADIASSINPDVIVMALSENDLGHYIFGHNASGVVNQTNVPVLMLPPGMEYRPLQRVVLACDLHRLSDKNVLQVLYKLLRIYNSELLIVHVVNEEGMLPTVNEAISGLQLDQYFSEFRHSFHFPVNEDVVSGINEFAESNNADLIVTIHHPRSLIKRLFTTLHTRQMSFNANAPILVLRG